MFFAGVLSGLFLALVVSIIKDAIGLNRELKQEWENADDDEFI